jgi:hypothetical protein
MPQPQFSVKEAACLQQRSYLPTRLHGVTSQKTVTFMITGVRAHGYTTLHHINKEADKKEPKMHGQNKNT